MFKLISKKKKKLWTAPPSEVFRKRVSFQHSILPPLAELEMAPSNLLQVPSICHWVPTSAAQVPASVSVCGCGCPEMKEKAAGTKDGLGYLLAGTLSALEIPQSIQRTAYPSIFCKYY
jgi:hypothetical protein